MAHYRNVRVRVRVRRIAGAGRIDQATELSGDGFRGSGAPDNRIGAPAVYRRGPAVSNELH